MVKSSRADTVLVIAVQSDIHADAVIYYLEQRGATIFRLDLPETEGWIDAPSVEWRPGTEDQNARLRWKERQVTASSIRSVYCRDLAFPTCPEGASIEEHLRYAEIKASILGYLRLLQDRHWVNNPWHDEMADNKPYQVACAAKIGIEIPPTLVTDDPGRLRAFYRQCDGRLVIKQLSEISLVDDREMKQEIDDPQVYGFYTERVLPQHIDQAESIIGTPCLFQQEIEKAADIRVTVIGERVFAHRIDSQIKTNSQTDFRKEPTLPISAYQLPETAVKKLLQLLRYWSVEFAACDYVLSVEEELIFIEANVAGNWLWLEESEDSAIAESIANHLWCHDH